MKKSTKILVQIALVIGLIFFGVSGLIALNALKPTMEKKTPPVATPMARTITVETQTVQVPIEGQGIVHPLQEIQLVPQVGGKVIHISPALVDGGQYQKNDILLKIDPADYHIAVTLAEARVKDAESKYILTEQESSVARSDWYQLNPGTPPPPLVAKEPQLATAKARLEAEKAELERARLNLSRTILKAPFDGRVSQKKVDIGQYIAPGQAVATLYSIEAAEIVLPMENDHLQWFHVPGFTPETKTAPLPAASSPEQPETPATKVEKITVEKTENGYLVSIETNGMIRNPTPFLVEGEKLVIDLPDLASDNKTNTIKVDGGYLERIRMAEHTTPRQKTRVVLDLKGITENEIDTNNNTLRIHVKPLTGNGNSRIFTREKRSEAPPAQLPSMDPENTVIVRAQIAGQQQIWKGRVVRAEGKVDELTRMINVVVRVNQPYSKKPPLAPGMFVTVDIKGKAIENAVIVPRSALHQDDIVWVINGDNRLEFRTVDVALRFRNGVVVRKGLSDKDQVVVSPLKEVTNGMKVRNVPANNGGDAS